MRCSGSGILGSRMSRLFRRFLGKGRAVSFVSLLSYLHHPLITPREEPSQRASLDPLEVAEHVRRCREALEATSAYRSEQLLRIDRVEEPVIIWTIEHVVPDRYHVVQSAWRDPDRPTGELTDQLFDEWLIVGSDHFLKIMGWMRVDQSSRMSEQFLLRKYLELLGRPDTRLVGVSSVEGSSYLQLECPSLPASSARIYEVPDAAGQTEMWVDLSTDMLARADQVWSQSDNERRNEFHRVEVFFDQGEAISIEPPEGV